MNERWLCRGAGIQTGELNILQFAHLNYNPIMDHAAKASSLPLVDTGFTLIVNDELLEGENGTLDASPTRLSASPSLVPSHSLPRPLRPRTNVRARNEARKLLSHVLHQLARRRKPVSVVDAFVTSTYDCQVRSFGLLPLTLKQAVKGIKPETKPEWVSQLQEDSDDEQPEVFSTDDTIDLVMQLEDVLAMSVSQGWQIFDDRFVTQIGFYSIQNLATI